MSDITDGIVVRGISNDGAFAKEDLDRDGRLMETSVNAAQGVSNASLAAVGMQQANFKRGYAAARAQDIIKKGGRVMMAPVSGNQNHCQIFGLSLKDANNLFSNIQPW